MRKRFFLATIIILTLTQCKNILNPPSRGNSTTKPILVSPQNSATGQPVNLTLSWQNVKGATSYRVQLSHNRKFSPVLFDSLTDSTSINVTGLHHDSTYSWKVKAINGSSDGAWSGTRTFTTVSNQDSANTYRTTLIKPGKGASNQSISMTLDWSSVDNATGYELQLSTQNDFSTSFLDTTLQSDSCLVSGMAYARQYYWKVKPVVSSGNAVWSDIWYFSTQTDPGSGSTSKKTNMWVTAYLFSYHHKVPGNSGGNLPTGAIDWSALTQLDYFAVNVNADGSLSKIAPGQTMSPSRIKAIVSAGHQHNVPVLITIGGWGNYDGFSAAIASAHRAALVKNVVSLLTTWGFDGIDLDMEPVHSSDDSNFLAFTKDLYNALQSHSTPMFSKPQLDAAVRWQPSLFDQLQKYFNQINVMTYNLSGAWQGWVTWHNSPLTSHGLTFPDTTEHLPSATNVLQEFIQAGISKKKMGIGVDFCGYIWSGGTGTSTGGVTKPEQGWKTAPTVKGDVPYYLIMDQYYQQNRYHWDSQADVPYLSINQSGSANDKFISYDNEQSLKDKIDYAKQQNLSGVMIWGLGSGYRSSMPAGQRDKLLQSVKNAVND